MHLLAGFDTRFSKRDCFDAGRQCRKLNQGEVFGFVGENYGSSAPAWIGSFVRIVLLLVGLQLVTLELWELDTDVVLPARGFDVFAAERMRNAERESAHAPVERGQNDSVDLGAGNI